MGFSREELAAVGWLDHKTGSYRAAPGSTWWGADTKPGHFGFAEQVAMLRLALAHPGRSAEALGEGWKADGVRRFTWSYESPHPVIAVWFGGGSAHVAIAGLDGWWIPPPKFDDVLPVARRIAAAWKEIG